MGTIPSGLALGRFQPALTFQRQTLRAMLLGICCCKLLPAQASLQGPVTHAELTPSPEPQIFHSGTRLVEVEVVVRNQPVRPPGLGAFLAWTFDSGPPFGPPGTPLKGLTKDDFTLLDEGKPQSIAVFRAGAASGSNTGDAKPMALPPGAVSNRQDSRGQPVNGATAVLIDFLNTDFGCLSYERLGMTNLLRSFAETDSRVALYTLGESLHVLHDFTDDPKK